MNKTQIEWVKNPDGTQGYTWNPITGCLNGCEYCYARKLANTRLREVYLANKNYPTMSPGEAITGIKHPIGYHPKQDPFYPRFWSDRCNRVDLGPRGKSKGIFVCDMSDLFGIGVPEEWTHRVLDRCKDMPQHRFYLLTKQPQNLAKFSPFPDNCWVGVTATNWLALSDALGHLATIEAKVKFLSFEPLLEQIQFDVMQELLFPRVIDWVIIGAMTCGGADLAKMSYQYPELAPMPYGNRYTLQPKIEWVEEIVKACDKAGVPVFQKDNLAPLMRDTHLSDFAYLRQEMP